MTAKLMSLSTPIEEDEGIFKWAVSSAYLQKNQRRAVERSNSCLTQVLDSTTLLIRQLVCHLKPLSKNIILTLSFILFGEAPKMISTIILLTCLYTQTFVHLIYTTDQTHCRGNVKKQSWVLHVPTFI